MDSKFLPKEKFWRIAMLVAILLFIFAAVFGYQYITNFYHSVFEGEKVAAEKPVEKNLCEVRRMIDGVCVSAGEENYYPIAVVIDNHEEARPAFGLAKANLVYEAEAEGRITRYLAIFASGEDLDEIGPTRSARPYFLDWLGEFSALFVHCGGSPEALARVIKEGVFNLNEFYNGGYFWRADDRIAPHNVFTSSKLLKESLEKKNLTSGKYFSWLYKEDSPVAESSATEIQVIFREPGYTAGWKYDPEKNDYLRLLEGELHYDASGDQIRAKNIIIQFTETKVIDELFRIRITTIGENKAIVCQDGACQEGTWKKTGVGSRTRYYNEAGEEIAFNAGTTWIEVMRAGAEDLVEIK